MDYKVIIILLALLFLIILVYREVSNLKDQMNKSTNNMSLQYRQNNDKMLVKFQNNMNKYVSQIKGISSDNLQQLRKITLLNHQPVIRKFTNHFTETDNSEIRTDLQYLSDANIKHKPNITDANNQIFEKKEISHEFYMSEDDPKRTKGSDAISECAERSSKLNKSTTKESTSNNYKKYNQFVDGNVQSKIICNGDKCYIKQFDNDDNDDDNNDDDNTIPIYHTENKSCDDIIPIYVSSNQQKQENIILKQTIPKNKTNAILDNDDEYESDGDADEDDDEDEDDNIANAQDIAEIIKIDIPKSSPTQKQTCAPITKNSLENSIIEDDGYTSEERITIPITPLNYKNDPKNKNEIEIDMFNVISGNKLLPNLTTDEITKIIKTGSNIKLNDIYVDDCDDDSGMQQNTTKNEDTPVDNTSEDTFNVETNVQKIDLSESIKNMLKSTNGDTDSNNESNDSNKKIILSIDEQIKIAKQKKQKDEGTIDTNETKSKMSKTSKISTSGFVNIGGTKNRKPKLSINTNIDDKLVKELKEVKEVEVVEVKEEFNLKTVILKKQEEYSFNDLRELSRKLEIPTTYKEKNKTKQYKKDELFTNIKSFVESKQNN